MVALDFDNSRMKDFYDVWTCAKHLEFDGDTLAGSIAATFARRDTPLPRESPLALTRAFSEAEVHQVQWKAFVRKIGEPELADKFVDMVAEIDRFLMPQQSRPHTEAYLASDAHQWDRGLTGDVTYGEHSP